MGGGGGGEPEGIAVRRAESALAKQHRADPFDTAAFQALFANLPGAPRVIVQLIHVYSLDPPILLVTGGVLKITVGVDLVAQMRAWLDDSALDAAARALHITTTADAAVGCAHRLLAAVGELPGWAKAIPRPLVWAPALIAAIAERIGCASDHGIAKLDRQHAAFVAGMSADLATVRSEWFASAWKRGDLGDYRFPGVELKRNFGELNPLMLLALHFYSWGARCNEVSAVTSGLMLARHVRCERVEWTKAVAILAWGLVSCTDDGVRNIWNRDMRNSHWPWQQAFATILAHSDFFAAASAQEVTDAAYSHSL